MGGRGSAYFEKRNAQIEQMMRQLQKLSSQGRKLSSIKIKEDPESKRNDYKEFKELKGLGISTRESTDESKLEDLRSHQTQLINLSNRYKNIINYVTDETEIEFSEYKNSSSYGFITSGEIGEKTFVRLALNKIVIEKPEVYEKSKADAIKQKWSAEVDSDKIKLYTTTHEFGHLIEFSIFKKLQKNGNDSLTYEKTATKIKNDVIKIYNKRYDNKDIYVSDYAKPKSSDGDFEWFAETFTNLELSSKPAPIALALGDYLKEIK